LRYENVKESLKKKKKKKKGVPGGEADTYGKRRKDQLTTCLGARK